MVMRVIFRVQIRRAVIRTNLPRRMCTMQFTDHHLNILFDVLRWRRDVRHFRSDPIDDQQLIKLEQAMALTPSVGNSRPWRVVRVESEDLRQRIIDNYEKANRAAADQYEAERRSAYLSLKLAGLREAPVHLAMFTDLAPRAGLGLGQQTMPETLIYSTVMAIHSLWLVARSINLGVGWVSILNPEDVQRCLDVPPSWHFTAYLCLGYAVSDDDTPELQRLGWQGETRRCWLVR
jgi:5,6-dimethylbenzimidazole synthase